MVNESMLFYGDNLDILRDHIQDDSIDLIYLDPPFNSKADYNILYKEPDGSQSKAQITAFGDTWHWTEETERTFQEIVDTSTADIIDMMSAFRSFIRANDMMAYLTMMCIRLIELRRVLKNTGSIYLHCDPTASHYLKILMDAIFGSENFRNEIIWCYKSRHFSKKHFGRKHDVILFYSKTTDYVFNWQDVLRPLSANTIAKSRYEDEIGRYRLVGRGIKGSPIQSAKDVDPKWEISNPELVKRDYLREGVPIEDYWQIDILNQVSKERLGYPTQKPEALLEKIIKASSNEGDVVLDPFCGCGTAISVAQHLNRNWIGIDVTHLAMNLIKRRMKNQYNLEAGKDYKVIGEPRDLSGAKALASQNRYQFQWWALSLIDARPYGDKKKGADTGIDGFIHFNENNDIVKKVIVQVKSGNTSVKDIRDLGHVVDREKAVIGIFITLEFPTRPMKEESAKAGIYTFPLNNQKIPKIQILTIEEILNGKSPQVPVSYRESSFKKAETKPKENLRLFDE